MFLPYKFIHKAQYTEMLNFTWSEKNGQLWTWISIARTNYSPSIYGTITATRTTKKNKIWEVKKRFTRENKSKQSKTRFSAFLFIKCPIIKINSSSKQYISGCFCIICSRHYQSIFQNFVNLLKLSRVRYFASSWNRNIVGVRTSCSHGNSIRIQCLGMHFSWFSNVGWSDT